MNLALPSVGFCLTVLSMLISNAQPNATWGPRPSFSGLSRYHHQPIHQFPIRRGYTHVIPSGGEGLAQVWGDLYLEERSNGVLIRGEIFGLKHGLHGFHVHQEGNLDNNCKASGGHFNPAGVNNSN